MYVPTVNPFAISNRVIICDVEPFPFVPVTWITGQACWGSPIAAASRVIRSIDGDVIRPDFSYEAWASR